LDDRFRLLTGGSRADLPRHQTLRASIDWSYNLLPEPQRVLLQRLSVFAGGWTLPAAEATCAGEGVEDWAILDALSGLVEKSLVVADHQSGAEVRYHMLETIRRTHKSDWTARGQLVAVTTTIWPTSYRWQSHSSRSCVPRKSTNSWNSWTLSG
jgi:predicted ATPase